MAELLILALGTIAGTAQNSAASDLYKRLSPSVFESADGTSSLGSSVVISSTQLLTNYHVIRDGKCFLDLGTVKVPLSVERFDSKLDLALLKTETRITANAVQLATSDPIPGASIWAIGNPEGLERSISQGIVSAVRDVDSRKYLQITAPISHGSSGGGIFDGSGILVGISVAFLKDGQNLNFAIPSSTVRVFLEQKSPATDGDAYSALLQRYHSAEELRKKFKYSSEPESDYQKTDHMMDDLLRQALRLAGDDYQKFKDVGEIASTQNSEIAIEAGKQYRYGN
jgi:Trypsin-like peptidase domain